MNVGQVWVLTTKPKTPNQAYSAQFHLKDLLGSQWALLKPNKWHHSGVSFSTLHITLLTKTILVLKLIYDEDLLTEMTFFFPLENAEVTFYHETESNGKLNNIFLSKIKSLFKCISLNFCFFLYIHQKHHLSTVPHGKLWVITHFFSTNNSCSIKKWI